MAPAVGAASAAVWESHRGLGKLSSKLLENVLEDPAWARRESFELLDREAWNPYPIQCWPLVLDPPKVEELARASVGLVDLLRAIPLRIFKGDLGRLAAFYRLGDPSLAPLIVEELEKPNSLTSRADLLETEQGLKVLEVNLGSPGGLQISKVASYHLQVPLVQDFFNEEGVEVSYTDSLQVLLRHVAEECLEQLPRFSAPRAAPLTVAILSNEEFPPGVLRAYRAYTNEVFREVLAELRPGLRGQVVLGLHRMLRERGGGVWLGPARLDAVIELGNSNWHATFRPWKSGQVRLYNGPVSMILADKRNLAFLSENQNSPMLSAEEQALVRDVIPWTRQVTPGYSDFEGERIQLRSFIAGNRERLVLKPGRSGQGKDVYIGQVTSTAEWEKALGLALKSGEWVAQEYIESRPYLAQVGDEGVAEHDVIWGIFTFGPHYGGGFLRMQPKGGPGIINAAQGAAEGVILEVR